MVVEPIFSVVDTETTGFRFDKGARIIEIAVVKMSIDGTILGTFSTLINPGNEVDLGAIEIHKITRSMISDAPTFAEITGDFISIVGNTLLVAHNAQFDTQFLVGEFELAGFDWPNQHVLDTLRAARVLIPGLPSYKLARLASHLDICFEGNPHAALADALVTAKLHSALLKRTDNLKWPDPEQITWPAVSTTGLVKNR